MKLKEISSETFPWKFFKLFVRLGKTVKETGHSASECPGGRGLSREKGGLDKQRQKTEPKEEWRSSWHVLQESSEL